MPAITVYQSTPVVLTDAQIKAIPTGNAIEVVAAPGANKMFQFLGGIARLNSVAGAYSNIKEGSMGMFRLGNRDISSRITDLGGYGYFSNWFGGEWDAPVFFPPYLEFNSVNGLAMVPSNDNYDNQPIRFVIGNYDSVSESQVDFTGGNATNTLELSALYTIIDV